MVIGGLVGLITAIIKQPQDIVIVIAQKYIHIISINGVIGAVIQLQNIHQVAIEKLKHLHSIVIVENSLCS